MHIILNEFVEDIVAGQKLVEWLFLLVAVGFSGTYCQIVEVLQGDHLLFKVVFYELDTDEFTDFVEHVVFCTNGVDALADALDKVENYLQLH